MLQEGYVDSARLMFEMKSADDGLASSLLSDLGRRNWDLVHLDVASAAKEEVSIRSSNRLRVLPVFVLCQGADDATNGNRTSDGVDINTGGDGVHDHVPTMEHLVRLFEGSSPFAAQVGGDAVLVLQSKGSAPVPFFERDEKLRLSLSDATPAVVAGLLRGLYGATPPDHWWPSERQDAALDLTWAHGYHPFAPFGFGGSEPGKLLVDIARRNTVASRAAAAAKALATAAGALEDFAKTSVPSKLIVGEELWATLGWGGYAEGVGGRTHHSLGGGRFAREHH